MNGESIQQFTQDSEASNAYGCTSITLLSGDSLVTAVDVAQQMPSLNQRPSEFERARVPAVEILLSFAELKSPR